MRPVERFGITSSLWSVMTQSQHRIMYDAIGADAAGLRVFNPQMVLGYDTGGPVIQWVTAEWDYFPGIPHVHVDQAGPGAPVYSANVMDIEPGAYSPSDVPEWMAHATAPRPTAYVDRNDCAVILANGYKGDIALAWPGWNGEALPGAPGQVVAVQNVFQQTYDGWVVLDPYWPAKAPRKETEVTGGNIFPGQSMSIPFPAGSFTKIMFYHDFTTAQIDVRVAIHSVSKGYALHDPYTFSNSVPNTIEFGETDVDGVSLVNKSSDVIGFTIA